MMASMLYYVSPAMPEFPIYKESKVGVDWSDFSPLLLVVVYIAKSELLLYPIMRCCWGNIYQI